MADKEALNRQLLQTIHSFEQEGLLNKFFITARSLKDVNGPYSFVELISTFRTETQSTLRTLTQEMDRPVVNYDEMEESCIKIKGSSSCIGIHRMALACCDLQRAIYDQSKEACFLALNRVKHEFFILQDKFDTICQLERRIITLELEGL
ncbi:histidine-containing phosphotransfer protein 5 [Ziziphus jujuba]|uniref:Histidine-containing phosphotransfer protein n=1 Tax=Ziziphus jujuba TaxID=326968 RepID=A0A6P6FZ25_ZIZJJ|nr:histidine-containing phosphotransfer protein 5 [Ziziphus jujuba]